MSPASLGERLFIIILATLVAGAGLVVGVYVWNPGPALGAFLLAIGIVAVNCVLRTR